jgi:hypothetical protein
MSDIAELFARDPAQLTREDRDAIITNLRNLRKQHVQGAPVSLVAKKGKTAAPETIPGLDIDI